MAALNRTRRRLLVTVACAAALSCAGAWPAAPATEYQVKAAYLFNFGRFVEWPASAYASPGAPFVIGVFGDDPFGALLDDVVRGESLDGHPLAVRRFRRPEDVAPCNILFIARSEVSRLEKVLQAVRGRPVLTVTDFEGAEGRDAIIVLLNENNRIRMRINVGEARTSELVISSKLLRPAELIGNEKG
jgi:YfiR/HmsC-like